MAESRFSEAPPPIVSLEELVTRKEFADRYGITEDTVDQWRYGRGGIFVPLPYLRFANRIYLWEGGIIWWLNRQSERPDFYYLDRKKRIEAGKKVGSRNK